MKKLYSYILLLGIFAAFPAKSVAYDALDSFNRSIDQLEYQQLNNNIDDLTRELNQLNRNIDSQNIQSQFSTKLKLYNLLRSMGMQVFFAKGEYKSGSGITYSCPASSSLYLSEFCLCNEGYEGDLLSKGCQKSEKTLPECPIHSKLSSSENICICDAGYEPDSSQKLCALIRNSASSSARPPASSASSLPRIPYDVPQDAWYRNALSHFVDQGVVGSSEQFRPDTQATRGDFIKLLVDSMNVPSSEIAEVIEPSFDDVPRWYQDAFEKAAKRGWLKGEGSCIGRHPCNARPDDPINRAAAAALIIRANELQTVDAVPQFGDAKAGQWYTESIRTAAGHCILQGSEGHVRPADNMNRAEMVAMLYRVKQALRFPNCQ